MNKKVFTLAAMAAAMMFGAAAHADTRIGVTIYKYDDNFMSVVRKAIEKDAKASPDVTLLMNDSQNDQSRWCSTTKSLPARHWTATTRRITSAPTPKNPA